MQGKYFASFAAYTSLIHLITVKENFHDVGMRLDLYPKNHMGLMSDEPFETYKKSNYKRNNFKRRFNLKLNEFVLSSKSHRRLPCNVFTGLKTTASSKLNLSIFRMNEKDTINSHTLKQSFVRHLFFSTTFVAFDQRKRFPCESLIYAKY